jgi:16S rRNA (cytosine967-C5)-methyltransferase
VNPARRRELGLPSDEDIEREAYELEMRAKGIAIPEREVETPPPPPTSRMRVDADDEVDEFDDEFGQRVERAPRPQPQRRERYDRGPRGGGRGGSREDGEPGRREHANGRGPRGRHQALPNPREVALQVLHAVETRDAFSDKLLQARFRDVPLSKRDRDLVVQIVKGTLRWRGRIDYILDRFLHQGMESLSPWARNTLRMGAFQILFLDRVPPHAATHESVRLASRYGHAAIAGLVNAVLRRICEEDRGALLGGPEGDDVAALAVRHSHPEWIVERWVNRFGVEGAAAIMEADNASRGVTLRVNTRRTTRDELQETLRAEGVETQPGSLCDLNLIAENDLSPRDLASFQEGRFTVQDEAETLVGRLVGAQPGEVIVDLCAGPGGKATQLSEATDDSARVIAVEPRWPRVRKIREAVDRLGLTRLLPVQADGTSFVLEAPADRVLVDAPCSGLGVLGKRADARWRKRLEIVGESADLQRTLLDAAAAMVKPGGVLVYSVCSFEPEETEEIVAWFRDAHPEFTQEHAEDFLPADVVVDHAMRLLPSQFGTDGAFAARFVRSA